METSIKAAIVVEGEAVCGEDTKQDYSTTPRFPIQHTRDDDRQSISSMRSRRSSNTRVDVEGHSYDVEEKCLHVSQDHLPSPSAPDAVAESSPLSTVSIEPEGGYRCWLQVVAAFLAFVNAAGLLNSFGIWQAAYARGLLSHEPESKIAWIGSMQGFCVFTIAVATGPIIDMGYLRTVTLCGTFLMTFGLCMASLASQLWQLLLSQSILVGIGAGCLFLPAVAIPPQWFPPNLRSTVSGIVATAVCFGAILYPLVFNALYECLGLAWATRVIGFILLPMNVFAALTFRMRTVPMKRRELFSKSVISSPAFWMSGGFFFFGMFVVYIPNQFMTQYAEQYAKVPDNLSQNMLPIIMAGGFVGRIVPDIVADHIGVLNVVIPSLLFSAVTAFCWIAVGSNVHGLIAFAILYGFFAGGWQSLMTMVVITTTNDFQRIGTRIGMSMFVAAFGTLAGLPIAGATLHSTGSYLGMQVLCGISLLIATSFMVALRLFKVGPRLMVKV